MSTRRSFVATLALGLLATPRAGRTQPPSRTARVGWIAASPGPVSTSAFFEAFRRGMSDKGWVEGRNLAIEARWGDPNRARDFTAELVKLKVNVIVAQGPAVFGAQAVAGSIPIVFGFSGDPVEAKLVASLARPGGNLTGVTFLALELVGKRLELVKETLPGLTRVAILANPQHPGEQAELKASQAAASRLGLTVQYLPVRTASDFDAAFDAMTRERAEAIIAFPDASVMRQAKAIAAFAAKRRIPAVSGWADFVVAGNLISYGPNLEEAFRYIPTYVDKILRGARPAVLPVEQPTKFELAVNLGAARALGLSLPPSILLRADRIIE
ncbi:MAG: ABC transporter substrate-binding protein [Candidatus Rokuibacteriota bacterium]